MKKRALLITAVGVFILGAILWGMNSAKQGFFIWFDSYIACPINENFHTTLTYYYKGSHDFSKVKKLYFENEDILEIVSFSIEDEAITAGEYKGLLVELDIAFLKEAVVEEQYLKADLNDGSTVAFSIGTFVFDIGSPEPTEELISTYTDVVATSNPNQFIFNYELLDTESVITEIRYGLDMALIDSKGLPTSGEVFVEGDAPVKYIKTKITVKKGDLSYSFYGKGFYCGAIDIDSDDVQKSMKHASESTLPASKQLC